jgi:hypothetical protein
MVLSLDLCGVLQKRRTSGISAGSLIMKHFGIQGGGRLVSIGIFMKAHKKPEKPPRQAINHVLG